MGEIERPPMIESYAVCNINKTVFKSLSPMNPSNLCTTSYTNSTSLENFEAIKHSVIRTKHLNCYILFLFFHSGFSILVFTLKLTLFIYYYHIRSQIIFSKN